jgi:hypothetical protein
MSLQTVKWLLSVGFSVSFCATLTLMTLTVVKIFGKYSIVLHIYLKSLIEIDGIKYSNFAQMCVTTTATRWLIGVWASPVS